MRILNIVFNAEIKYQQYAKLRIYRHRYFRSNFDPGKTPKGKPVKGYFYYLGASENSVTAYSSSEI